MDAGHLHCNLRCLAPAGGHQSAHTSGQSVVPPPAHGLQLRVTLPVNTALAWGGSSCRSASLQSVATTPGGSAPLQTCQYHLGDAARRCSRWRRHLVDRHLAAARRCSRWRQQLVDRHLYKRASIILETPRAWAPVLGSQFAQGCTGRSLRTCPREWVSISLRSDEQSCKQSSCSIML